VTEITLSTGRKVLWSRVPGKDHKLDIHYRAGDPTPEERQETATKINEVLQPDKETFNAA
jgi:hypothetical protein